MAIMMKKRKAGSSTTLVSLKNPNKLSSLLRPDNTAYVLALEALLRNPIRFTPAIELTKYDKPKMANSDTDRIAKWKSDRDRREKRRRLVVGGRSLAFHRRRLPSPSDEVHQQDLGAVHRVTEHSLFRIVQHRANLLP